jgi:NADP-dependent 3-hydroxy acid dehydrogenase YdfG
MNDGPGLAGRTALVTGASSGIGRAAAIRLVNEGARVWGLARSSEALNELSKDYGVSPIVADLADDTAVWLALDELSDTLDGAPDIVVNSAGVFGVEPCATESIKTFDVHLQVNLRAPFLVIRALLPSMLARGSGLIINVGSVAGRKAFPGNAAYSASKFGLRGLHGVLVEETRGTGVRATLVEPTATDTALWDSLDPDTNDGLPNRADMLAAEDVANVIAFAATRPDGVVLPVLQVERN